MRCIGFFLKGNMIYLYNKSNDYEVLEWTISVFWSINWFIWIVFNVMFLIEITTMLLLQKNVKFCNWYLILINK